MRYIGLDLSMTGPGFAAVEVIDRKPVLLGTATISTTAKDRDGVRLRKIGRKMKTFIEEYGPFDTYIKEQSFSRFPKDTQQIFKTVGVTEYILHDYEIVDIAATTIKKHVAGSGKASKEEVAAEVCRTFGLKTNHFDKRNDESDAIAVILCYLIQNDLIDWKGELE